MNSILSKLLMNTSGLSGASFLFAPDDGAGAGAGETSAPAADTSGTPAVGTTEGVAETPDADDSSDMFAMPTDDALFTLDEQGEVETPPPPAPAKAPAAATPGATPAATPPAAATPSAPGATPPAAVTPPAPAAATPPAATATPTPQTPPAEAVQPAPSILELLDQGRPQLTAELQKIYAISDADAEAIGIVDKAPLEKLAANLHFNVMRSAIQMFQQTLPAAISNALAVKEREEELTQQFYAANTELDRKTDHQLVTHYARMFWAANPKGTLEDMNKQVGTMVKAHLNKLTATVTPPPSTPGVQPKKVPMKPSFTPATPGGVAPATKGKGAPQGADLWGALAERMMNTDEE